MNPRGKKTRIWSLTRLLCTLSLLAISWGCAHAHGDEPLQVALKAPSSQPIGEREDPLPSPGQAVVVPTSQPTGEPRSALLRRGIEEILAQPELAGARVSLLVAPLRDGDPLFAIQPDARRVPASNAKLLTTVAAALTLPGYRFKTRVYRRGKALVLEGGGDPILKRRDLVRLASRVKRRGIRSANGIIVDDRAFSRKRLAPGFESFSEGAYYRPTSSALNVDGNAIVIKVSAPRERRRPRVDVFPPSDYIKVRKLVKFSRRRTGPESRRANISVSMQPRGSIMWLTISGTIGRRARPWSTRRAVYDPSLNAGWAFRRALVEAGIDVKGVVRRGVRPRGATALARHVRTLKQVVAVTNRISDNLCAETLVRIMGCAAPRENGQGTKGRREKGQGRSRCVSKGSWAAGLSRLTEAVNSLGVTQFSLGNGSGLHRRSWVTASAMVQLLRKIHERPKLFRRILASLPVAGQSGTLGSRMRHTAAEGIVHAKTGTLSGALALSGYIAPTSESPLVFSLLINGRSNRSVRDRMDQIVILLSRYASGVDLEDSPQPTSTPSL